MAVAAAAPVADRAAGASPGAAMLAVVSKEAESMSAIRRIGRERTELLALAVGIDGAAFWDMNASRPGA